MKPSLDDKIKDYVKKYYNQYEKRKQLVYLCVLQSIVISQLAWSRVNLHHSTSMLTLKPEESKNAHICGHRILHTPVGRFTDELHQYSCTVIIQEYFLMCFA